mmetsp:Transcript_8652/g.17855  ORF Transcript_8652/g.17855 Transcript_8652/m.17855 type:complete len:122 (+) Transcript_8652:26-391(+)|eukprot:CAMPEP_0182487500 /NCGR_PEP_ID=MMETSP1319-20130603/47938_1 /TAXON_ID=172717 /ORGANISM="Bolidomonas pacifica, Strain RCC208" /LENGTH=121 /DNA_ID=CAMNT_0024689623 /DNA_START=422 /DNA_END=787 /DNA_ORIENTATION=+
MSAQEIAQAFVQHYYTTRDTNPTALASLYQDGSTLTFEGTMVQGGAAISQKFQSIGPVKHQHKSMDVQPGPNSSYLVIFITGSVQIGGDNPLHYCHFFQLVSTGPGAFYVHNEVFRLNYGL